MNNRGKCRVVLTALPLFFLFFTLEAFGNSVKPPMPLCNFMSLTQNAGISKEQDMYHPGLVNYTRDYPQGVGSPPSLENIKIVRDFPFPGEYITVQLEAKSLRDASDGLGDPPDQSEAAMKLLWAEVAVSLSNGTSWYVSNSALGPGVPMDFFTREVLSVVNTGNSRWKTYVSATKNWAVTPISFAYTGGEPAPNRRGNAAPGTYKHPFDYPCPYGNNCPMWDTWAPNTVGDWAPFPTPSCSKGGLNCNVPGFPEGAGDIMDNFPAYDPVPLTNFPNIPGEPVVRVNGIPGIACDIYNGTQGPVHPICAEHPDAAMQKIYDSYGIFGYTIIPGQGKVVFKHPLTPQAVVDALFYSNERLTWTARIDLSKAPFNVMSSAGKSFIFNTRVYDTCGNMAAGAQAPPYPTFNATTNENIAYLGVEDSHWDMAPTDQDPLVQIKVDDTNTQCGATDDWCPNPAPAGWDPLARGTCGDAGCECCYNECAPTVCPFNGAYGACAPTGDGANAPGCGPEYGSNTGMLEIHNFKMSHTNANLYLKVETKGNIIWGCYGGWYPIIGCEQWSFGTDSLSKFNGYGFQITNTNPAKAGAFYVLVIPEIPIYGSMILFIDVEALKNGALGSLYDGRELEEYADGGGCKKPGSDPPAKDPCEEIGCDPTADPGGDCDNDGFINNTDACPCSNGGKDSTDGCSPPSPPSDNSKFSCQSCAVEVQGNRMYLEVGKDGQIGFVGDNAFRALAMLLSVHDLNVDMLLYKACLNNYSLTSLATDTSPRVAYYENTGSKGRFSVTVRQDLVPPEAPKIQACLGRCDEPVTTNGIDDDADPVTLEPDATYRVDEGYDPTATMIELKFKEILFNVDSYSSFLTDLAGYKIYMNRGSGSAWQHYYTICSKDASLDCDGQNPKDPSGVLTQRSDPALDEPYAPNGTRFPKPIDLEAALTGFGFPGEPISCIIEDDCDIPGNNIDDDKDGAVDEGCFTTNCKYDNNPTLKLAEDGQTYSFKVDAYDKNGNYSIFSNEVSATILRNTTAPSMPKLRNVYTVTEGRSLKLAWDLNSETDIGGYSIYRCPARPIDSVRLTEAGVQSGVDDLLNYCSNPNNYRQVNKDILVSLKDHEVDYGTGFYEGGAATGTMALTLLCQAGSPRAGLPMLFGDDDCDWNPATDDLGADGQAGTLDAGEGDGIPTPGEPHAYEWIDCGTVSPTNADLLLCGNVSATWTVTTPLFNAQNKRINLFQAKDATRPVLFHNGLVDGYKYYYRIKAIDRPYAGDGLAVPGSCNKGLNSWQRATKKGCVNPIEDVDGQAPLLKGRNCDDPLIMFNWDRGGNCSVFSDIVSGAPADTQPPARLASLAASGNGDGKSAQLQWNMLSIDPSLDHFRVYMSNKETGPYACYHGGCDTPPYIDGCKCTSTAECYSGRSCDYPVKICTNSPFFTLKAQPSGCGTAPFNDGCQCNVDDDCLKDVCTSGKCSLSGVDCQNVADCTASRSCTYPFTVCKPTGVSMTASDGIDNDGDGMIDEEIPDGVDNDNDGLVDEDTGLRQVITNPDNSTTFIDKVGQCPALDLNVCTTWGICAVSHMACVKDSDCAALKYEKFDTLTATVKGLSSDHTYFFKVSGVDNAVFHDPTSQFFQPNEGEKSLGVPVVPRDQSAPAMPTGACGPAFTRPCVAIDTNTPPRDDYGGRLTVTWNKNSEIDVQGYYILRAGVTHGAGAPSSSQFIKVSENLTLQPTSGASVSYKDSGLINGMDYYYMITAVDAHYNQSPLSELGGPGTPKDTIPNSAPLWNPLYRIPNIGCAAVARPSSCNTDIAVDCNTGGVFAEGTGDAVFVQWAAHNQTVCVTDSPSENDFRSWNLYRSEDIATCGGTTSTTCNPGFPCRVAANLTTPFYKQTTNIVAGTTYYYCMTAVDASGNESAISTVYSVVPVDKMPPEAPTNLTATPLVNSAIGLGWNSGADTDVAGYRIYRSLSGLEGSFTTDLDGIPSSGDEVMVVNALSYTDAGLITDQTYYYKISAVDNKGNEGAKSTLASARTTSVDSTPPVRPANIYILPGYNKGETPSLLNNGLDDDKNGFIDDANMQERRITIFWDRVSISDLTQYKIYRLDPPAQAACTCDVTANPNGDCDNDLVANAIDDCPCTPVNKTADQFRGSFTPIKTIDPSEACPQTVHGRPVGLLSANACFFTDTNSAGTPPGLCKNDQYWYIVTGVDSSGNETALDPAYAAPAIPVSKPDNQVPDAPEKPKVVVIAGGGALTVKFHPNNPALAQNKDIVGYIIYRDTKAQGTFNYKVSDINDLNKVTHCDTTDLAYICISDYSVINGQRYYYKVMAYDPSGNKSPLSDFNFGTPATTLPPNDAASLSAQPDPTSIYTLRVRWSPGALQTNPVIAGFKLLRSAAQTGVWNLITPQAPTPEGYFPKTSNIYTDINLTMGQQYCYKLITVDTAANESAGATACGIPGSDTIPPAPPSGITAFPGNNTASLRWSLNSEPDLAGYNIYVSTEMNGAYTKVNSSPVTYPSFTQGGLTNGTLYWYKITAFDDSGNESSFYDPVTQKLETTAVSVVPGATAGSSSMTRPLAKGWNLLSIPATGGSQASITLQSGKSMLGSKAFSYGPGGYMALPLGQNINVTPGMAIWYYMDDAADPLNILSQLNTAPQIDIQLKTGWNLVGNPFTSSLMWNDDHVKFTSDDLNYVALSEAVSSNVILFSVVYDETADKYKNLKNDGSESMPIGAGFWLKLSRPVKIRLAQ